MSSEQSSTSSSSRLSQFGLYRTIDARTEEFLRLSKKRQIRQGCACAVISTAITITIVIVILLIYEHAIAVEFTLVQRKGSRQFGKNTNATLDRPFAERLLDRNYFGFDQDYYERMPLMVNAMQENSFLDPSLDNTPLELKPNASYIITNFSKPVLPTTTTISYRSNGIRRTSPRPFHYEYRSPAPTPFSKTYGSRSWVESYRNAQRLKNLHQVIKYLEKTINAKLGDMYAQPTSTHIGFSGIYVEPEIKVTKPTINPLSSITELLQPSSSNKVVNLETNHKIDPLFSFKPESPGDVNMLADGFFRFSPLPIQNLRDKVFSTTPMFRQIRHHNKHCIGLKCYEEFESKFLHAPGENKNNKILTAGTPKSFSVMLNLFPIKSTESSDIPIETSPESLPVSVNHIYFTTSKPMVQFRRKSTTPIRRTTTRFKRPKVFIPRFIKTVPSTNSNLKESVNEPKMIVHVNVYPPIDLNNKSQGINDSVASSSTTQSTTYRYVTEMPILKSTQVEDYHVGSSGIIPVESRWLPSPPPPDPTAPPITTIPPPLPPLTTSEQVERTPSSTETISWDALPKVIKFNEEDAKIPDEYQPLLNTGPSNEQPEIRRRNSKECIETNSNESSEDEKDNIAERRKKLIIRLRNAVSTTEQNSKDTETSPDNDDEAESMTVRTYVPQINGHYRSVNQNSKNINKWLTSTESRKKRLEMSITGLRKTTYVPQYVEIKRNNTKNSS